MLKLNNIEVYQHEDDKVEMIEIEGKLFKQLFSHYTKIKLLIACQFKFT
jgi:hypothetical protein